MPGHSRLVQHGRGGLRPRWDACVLLVTLSCSCLFLPVREDLARALPHELEYYLMLCAKLCECVGLFGPPTVHARCFCLGAVFQNVCLFFCSACSPHHTRCMTRTARDGVVIATEKKVPSVLVDETSFERQVM